MFSHKNNSGVTSTNPFKRLFSGPVKWFVVSSLLLCVIVATLVVSLNVIPRAHAATFTQVWSDEFNQTSNTGVDSSKWIYDKGTSYCSGCANNWGTDEVETMTDSTSNVYQDGQGHMVIKAINNNGTWTSGRIETKDTSFAAPVGGVLAVEASIKLPDLSGSAASGYWPAFWMLGSDFRGKYNNWPGIGEVDIMENVNGLASIFSTLHCGIAPGGPCNEKSGLSSGQYNIPGDPADFHTYRVEIDRSVAPEEIRWYLDGKNFFTLFGNQVDQTTWSKAVDHSFFIILNLAVGGAFPQALGGEQTNATQSGGAMVVDYVRVSTKGGSDGTTSTPTSTNSTTPTPTSANSGTTSDATPTPGNTTSASTPTPGATTATPAPNSGGSCSGTFAQNVMNSSSGSASPWFQLCGSKADQVILHYTVSGQPQQNVNMTYNSSTSRWEYTVNGLSAGQTLTYSFSYQQNGNQYDTSTYSWPQP